MKLHLTGSAQKPSGDAETRWSKLAGDEVTSVDRDIETIVGLLQERHGYTRDVASAELVRRLSFAA